MDFPSTQVYVDENDFGSTKRLDVSSQRADYKQVGILIVGSTNYPINKGINTIGRHPACDITINEQTISKKHAEIEASQSSAWICDLHSSNKTKLNNSVLRPDRCYELKDGSIIDFGRVRATYRHHEAVDDFLVAETPLINRQRKQQEYVVAATPDSSLNNSSVLAGDVSAIPATQDFEGRLSFRRPSQSCQQQTVHSIASTSILTNSPRNDSFAEATSSKSERNIFPGSDDEASTNEIDVQCHRKSLNNLKSSTVPGSSKNDSLRESQTLETRKDFCPDSDEEAGVRNTEIQPRQQPVTSIGSAIQTSSKNDSTVESASGTELTNCQDSKKDISIYDIETQEQVLPLIRIRSRSTRNSHENNGPEKNASSNVSKSTCPPFDSSIYDMETQKPEKLIDNLRQNFSKSSLTNTNEEEVDIYDRETQIAVGAVDNNKESINLDSTRNYSPVTDPKIRKKISIYDMETQKPCVMANDQISNIHDMETQKPFAMANDQTDNIYDIETQKPFAMPSNQTDNIYDMETQKPIAMANHQAINIHDRETQKILPDDMSNSRKNIALRKEPSTYVNTIETPVVMERMVYEESETNSINIHDMETQDPVGIAGISSRKLTSSPERHQFQDDNIVSTSTSHDKQPKMDDISKMETQKITNESINSKTSVDEQDKNDSESSERPNSPSQEVLRLSIDADFDEDCKELDVSVSDTGSQNLLENYIDEDSLVSTSKDTPHSLLADVSKDQNQYAASSEEDDIFDAVTQKPPSEDEDIFNAPTQRVNIKASNNLVSDDSETDEEGVFQNFERNSLTEATKSPVAISKVGSLNCNKNEEHELRLDTCVIQKIEMNNSEKRQPVNNDDDDDSITDEEGIFTQLVEKVNNTAGSTSTIQQDVAGRDNHSSIDNGDTDDIDDLPTQFFQFNDKERVDVSKTLYDGDNKDEELDQTITIKKTSKRPNDQDAQQTNTKEKEFKEPVLDNVLDIDDMTPTQMIHVPVIESPSSSPTCSKTNESRCIQPKESMPQTTVIESATDIDDMAPTQMINAPEIDSPGSPVCSKANEYEHAVVKPSVHEKPVLETIPDIEDMAPTQMINVPAIDSPESPVCSKANESEHSVVKSSVHEKPVLETIPDIDDMAPTQMIHAPAIDSPLSSPTFSKTDKSRYVEPKQSIPQTTVVDSFTDFDDMVPTQVIHAPVMDSPLGSPTCSKADEFGQVEPKESIPHITVVEPLTDIDDMAPTQMIHPEVDSSGSPTCSKVNESEHAIANEKPVLHIISDMDNMTPTQVMYIKKADSPVKSPINLTTNEDKSENSKEESTSDIDMLPTQKIHLSKDSCNTEGSQDEYDGYSSDASGLYTEEKCGIEDIEYEMAATQLISEVETERNKKSTSGKTTAKKSVKKGEGKKGKSKRNTKINLNDTIERNLNDMFDEVDVEEIQEPQALSTQLLQTMLQPSQESNELSEKAFDIDDDMPEASTAKKCRDKNKSNGARITTGENSDSQNTENYFSTLTSIRKRNVLEDSQNSTSTIQDIRLTDEKLKDEEGRIDEVASNSAHESDTRIANADIDTNIIKTCNIEHGEKESTNDQQNSNNEAKNDEITTPPVATDIFDEYCLPKISESLVRTSILIDDDEVDIMAGLPEVRIAGTLSNPPSPTGSVSNRSDISTLSNSNRAKSTVQEASKSRTRRMNRKKGRISKESTIIAANQLSLFSESLCVDEMPVRKRQLQYNKENASGYKITRRSAMKKPDKDPCNAVVLLERLPLERYFISLTLPLRECLHVSSKDLLSAPYTRTTRSRRSVQKNDDCSSVFQVAKEDPGESVGSKALKKNIKRQSRSVKRSLTPRTAENEQINRRSVQQTESKGNVQKRKNNEFKEETGRSNKSRRSSTNNTTNSRQSPTIRDFFPTRDSPLTIQQPESPVPFKEKHKNNKNVIKNSNKTSQNAKVESAKVNPPEKDSKKTRRKTADDQNTSGKNSIVENKEHFTEMQTSTPQRTSINVKAIMKNLHPALSEESQEVAMIMDDHPTLHSKTDTLLNIKNEGEATTKETKGRRGRKRLNPNESVSSGKKLNNTSSEVSEPPSFEVPTSKPKRAKISNDASTAIIEPSIAKPNKRGVSSRTSRNLQQSLIDSGGESSLETSKQQEIVAPVKRGRGRPKRKPETKIEDTTYTNDSTSSGIDTSVENRLSTVTPTKQRRSMSTSISSLSSPAKIRQKILFTGIPDTNEYSKILAKLGASQVEDPTKCTVLVTDKVRRTVKFLCALAQSIPIVSIDWLVESGRTGEFVDMQDYILKDPASEAKFCFKLKTSLEKAQQHKLLDGYTIILTPNVAPPSIPELKSIISSCGGKPLIRPPSSWPEKAVIISREDDMANARKIVAKAPKSVSVQSTEFLLTGILQQQLDFTKYKLI